MAAGDSVRFLEQQVGPWVELAGGGPPNWAPRMAAYLELLREWNQRVNLVSRKSIDRVIEEQLVPSLAALGVVAPGKACRVLDIGSGGGFPGIPLAILRPAARVDLVDSVRKKCLFLEEAVRVADLRACAVHWCRVESPSPSLLARRPFDVAIARAVGHLEPFAAEIGGLLVPGGPVWTFVRPGSPESQPWPPQGDPLTALRPMRGA